MYIVRVHLCENQEHAKPGYGDGSNKEMVVGESGSGELTEEEVRELYRVMEMFYIFLEGSSQIYKIVEVH